MHRDTLRQIVIEQQQDLAALPQGIARQRLADVIAYLKLPHIVAITGIRRCGKSTLMRQAIHQAIGIDNCYYLDFEDERLLGFTVDDFNQLYEVFVELFGERQTFVFDEIQIIPGWESFVRRMHKNSYKFMISGSSADLLSSELSTKLTGRHVTVELLPFSFQEYLGLQSFDFEPEKPLSTKEKGLLQNAFNSYIEVGGIPEYLHHNNPIILRSLYENVVFKDVIVRYGIKATKALREIAIFLLSNSGGQLSYTKLKNSFQLGSINTIKDFVHYLENAFLVFSLDKFSYSLKEQAHAQKKTYAVDTGLINALGFQHSRNSGKLLENAVYLELRRRLEHDIYYYRTQHDFEVDFCLRQGRKVVQLIQVCENLEDADTRKRELRALTEAMQELDLKEGWIISRDHNEVIHQGDMTIHVLAAPQWLLTPPPSPATAQA